MNISNSIKKIEVYANINLILILAIVPLSQIAIDLNAPSLPKMKEFFGTNSSVVQFTVTLYFLGYGLFQPVFGMLSDRYGRRSSLIFSNLFFVVASLLCYNAESIYSVIFYRFIQGISGAGIAVNTRASLSDSYTGRGLIKASAYVGVVWGVAPIIAPVLGGYFQEYLGWRFSFLFLSIYSTLCLLLFFIFFKETLPEPSKKPVLDALKTHIEMMKDKPFLFSTLVISVTNFGIFIYAFMAPFLIQDVMGKSAIYFGTSAFILGCVYIIGALFSKYAYGIENLDKHIKNTCSLIIYVSVITFILSFIFPLSIFLLFVSSSFFMFISGFIYPSLFFRMYKNLNTNKGIISANYGFLSYVFSTLLMCGMSLISINSFIPIAFGFLIIGLCTLGGVRYLFE